MINHRSGRRQVPVLLRRGALQMAGPALPAYLVCGIFLIRIQANWSPPLERRFRFMPGSLRVKSLRGRWMYFYNWAMRCSGLADITAVALYALLFGDVPVFFIPSARWLSSAPSNDQREVVAEMESLDNVMRYWRLSTFVVGTISG